jgi:uncharacterized protein
MFFMNTVKQANSELARKYWTTLGIVLTIGFAINYFMVKTIPAESVLAINPIVLLISYFVCCFGGIYLSKKSDNPVVSFIGYLMVVVPVGVVIIPFVQQYDPAIVEKAVLFTAMLSAGMSVAGAMYPKFFRSIGGILFWALLISIIAEVIMLFIGYELAIMDWIVAVIFLGLIGYDYAMALEDEPTIDAAVDRAVSLYLDIINLFLRILSILGRK